MTDTVPTHPDDPTDEAVNELTPTARMVYDAIMATTTPADRLTAVARYIGHLTPHEVLHVRRVLASVHMAGLAMAAEPISDAGRLRQAREAFGALLTGPGRFWLDHGREECHLVPVDAVDRLGAVLFGEEWDAGTCPCDEDGPCVCPDDDEPKVNDLG